MPLSKEFCSNENAKLLQEKLEDAKHQFAYYRSDIKNEYERVSKILSGFESLTDTLLKKSSPIHRSIVEVPTTSATMKNKMLESIPSAKTTFESLDDVSKLPAMSEKTFPTDCRVVNLLTPPGECNLRADALESLEDISNLPVMSGKTFSSDCRVGNLFTPPGKSNLKADSRTKPIVKNVVTLDSASYEKVKLGMKKKTSGMEEGLAGQRNEKNSEGNQSLLDKENAPQSICDRDTEGVWTLQYLQSSKSKGIKRLLASVRVYVKESDLSYAKRTALSQNTLARALLTLVFKENALKICTAAKTKASVETKTMLHQGAMGAIYKYVMEQDLPGEGFRTMKHSVSQKISEIKKEERLNKEVYGQKK